MEESSSQIRQPLNLYSVFGYLLPGFFLVSLFVIDRDGTILIHRFRMDPETFQLSVEGLILEDILQFFSAGTMSDFKFIPFLLFLLFCYLIGHLISAFSSSIIEQLVVKKIWRFPSSNLIAGEENKKGWLLSNFRRPLKKATKKEIKKAANDLFDFKVNKEDYYWLFYSYIITKKPHLAVRIHHFVNLYGFSRNVCATFIIYIIFRLIMSTFISVGLSWATIFILSTFLISAVFMFLNYAKLYKRQALDIYFLFLAVYRERKDSSVQEIEKMA